MEEGGVWFVCDLPCSEGIFYTFNSLGCCKRKLGEAATPVEVLILITEAMRGDVQPRLTWQYTMQIAF